MAWPLGLLGAGFTPMGFQWQKINCKFMQNGVEPFPPKPHSVGQERAGSVVKVPTVAWRCGGTVPF